MSGDIGTRVINFARQIVDVHLPVLVGLMAEAGQDPYEQSERASRMVALLRSAEVAESLSANGRPVPVQIEGSGKYRRLIINGEMLARVDDAALASAVAGPLAQILDISPVTTGLVLQMSDVREMRGLAGTLGRQLEGPIVPMTKIKELVSWRLQTFEERLYRLVDGLGGWLEAPVVIREDFIDAVGECDTRWPEWRKLKDQPYIKTWLDEVAAELGRTVWADSTQGLGEMIWDSVAISPRSALRQAARNLRSLATGGDRRELLEVLAQVVGGEDDPIPGNLEHWPAFQELLDAWNSLWGEEDNALGARRRAFAIPHISVYEAPGRSMGYAEPENLPWDQPLLCWTLREREALRDLLGGSEKSLAQSRAQVRLGRLSESARGQARPLTKSPGARRWAIQVPTRVPAFAEGFSRAVDRAYAAIHASYKEAFSTLDAHQQKQAFKLTRSAYPGYLSSTKPIWKRRLSVARHRSLPQIFDAFMTGIADALEWPVFIDVFEGDPDRPSISPMPRFTIPAVWYGEADFAPAWLPIETLGEALGQAPIRVRNVAIDADTDQVRWLGDHQIELTELQGLRTDSLLRSIHEGTLMITLHQY